MKKICLLLAVLFASFAFAEDSLPEVQSRYLHISTIPSVADAYLNDVRPDHASNPDYRLPEFIPVPDGESSVLVSIFRPEFADTLINVHLSEKDTSYLIVALRPTYDENYTEKQISELNHRGRRNLGHKLLFTSIVPLLVGGISTAVEAYQISKANDAKASIDNSLIREGSKYQKSVDDFKDHRSQAKTARNVAKVGLISGGIILATGIILSF